MVTYALVYKKIYTDLSTSLDKEVYGVEKVFYNEEDALLNVSQYEVYAKLGINSIDSNGIFKSFECKIQTFDGELTRDQVQAMMTAAPDMIWNQGRTR